MEKIYTVDRIAGGRVLLLDREDESIQVIVNESSFAKVSEGDIVKVTWTDHVGGASYSTILEDETMAQREKISSLLEKLKNKPRR